MKKVCILVATALMVAGLSVTASAQNNAQSSQRSAYSPYQPYNSTTHNGEERVAETFEITHETGLRNARAGIGVGLALPGFVAFQGNFASFGGILPGLYLDLRLTGTTAGTVFGDGSPMWANSFEVDLRVGYGSRTIGNHKSTIKDKEKRTFESRIPGAFGVTPYIGWRGRWGYHAQQIRVGLHVERNTNVEVRFTDGRVGSAFNHWAFDFELLYSGGWQKGLGGTVGYDLWFNDFIFLRTELGYARPNSNEFAPSRINPFTGDTNVGAGEGFWAKTLLNFAFQFNLPDVTEKDARAQVDEDTAVRQRVHSHEVQGAAAGSSLQDTRATGAAGAAGARGVTRCQADADCDDGIFCNGAETCTGGVCQPGKLPDDGISCTQLVCDEFAKEFRFEPLHGLCGDGIFCNGTELCDPQVGCVAGTPIPVDDGNPCTRDFCDETQRRVVNEPISGCENAIPAY